MRARTNEQIAGVRRRVDSTIIVNGMVSIDMYRYWTIWKRGGASGTNERFFNKNIFVVDFGDFQVVLPVHKARESMGFPRYSAITKYLESDVPHPYLAAVVSECKPLNT